MAEEVGKGVVKIEADAKGLGRDINREVDKQSGEVEGGGKKLGTGFGTAFKVGAGIAIAAGVAFAASAVGAASDLAESANAVNVTFGKSADGIAKLGREAATAVGLSTADFNSLAVRFSSFADTIAGPGGDVVDVMDEMTTRAADFASVMNLDVADAAGIFQSGLAGESEPLKQYGIDLSAAAVEAFAAANGIGTLGEELTEAEKVQARYGLLMEETNKTAGDFANTSDGLANQQRIMAAEFENVKAKIGAALIPIMSTVVKLITTKVIPAFITIRDVIAAAFEWIIKNKAVAIAAFTAFGVVVLTALVPAFLAWAAAAIAAAAPTILAAAPVIALGLAVAGLAAGIVWLYQNVDIFRNAVNAVRDFIMDHVVPAFQTIVDIIQEHVVPVVEVLVEVYIKALVTEFKIIKAIIMDVLIPAFKAIVDFVIDHVIPIFVKIVEWGIKPLKLQIEVIKTVITDILIPAFQTIVSFIADKVIPIFVAIGTAIGDAARIVGEKVGEIVDFVLGIAGKIAHVVVTLFAPIKDAITGAANWVGDRIEDIVDFAKALPGRMVGLFSGMWDGIKDAFKAAINWVIRAWNNLEFKVPGFSAFGVDVGGFTIGVPDIPQLANGAVITAPTVAMLGEYNGAQRNPEIVSPVKIMADTFRDVINGQYPENMTLIIEGKPFTAMIAKRDRELVGALRAGQR